MTDAPQPPEASPEARARQRIDALLQQVGWAVQNRNAVNLAAAEGVAVRELPSGGGEADYGLFLGRELVGVVEAKKLGSTLGGVEAQTLAYASETLPGLVVPIRPLPFRYESTGAETFSPTGWSRMRRRGACSASTGRPRCASGSPHATRSRAAWARRRR
jgi:type I site-specific restriction endonuclease